MKRIINKLLILMLTISGCNQFSSSENMDKTNIRIFNQTPAWGLVKAIEKDDSKMIEDILHENPNLLNYQEPVYGISPIQRAIGRRKYAAAKTLIKFKDLIF